jgi:hypothetical protein
MNNDNVWVVLHEGGSMLTSLKMLMLILQVLMNMIHADADEQSKKLLLLRGTPWLMIQHPAGAAHNLL